MTNVTQSIEYLSKDQATYLRHRLSAILPEYFRLHSKLLELADPISGEINCPLCRLAKKLKYDPRVLYFYLVGIETVEFITFTRMRNFRENMTIKVLVRNQ